MGADAFVARGRVLAWGKERVAVAIDGERC
jgi:hypothetical protein